MLHFHLLAGGAIFAGIIFSLIFNSIRYKIRFRVNFLSIVGGMLLFFLLVSYYFIWMLRNYSVGEILSPVFSIRTFSLFGLARVIGTYFLGIFAPGSTIYYMVEGKFGWKYLPFSILPGMVILYTIYNIIKFRKNKMENFIGWVIIFFLFFSSHKFVFPYHFNYLLVIIVPLLFCRIPSFSKNQEKWIQRIVIASILLNFIQLEMIRKDIMNSSFSFYLHKMVARYLKEEKIYIFYNMVGNFGYLDKEIKMVLSIPSSKTDEDISRSLLSARGGVILLERSKYSLYTSGIGPEDVARVATEKGMVITLLKKFPEDKNPTLFLLKIR